MDKVLPYRRLKQQRTVIGPSFPKPLPIKSKPFYYHFGALGFLEVCLFRGAGLRVQGTANGTRERLHQDNGALAYDFEH